MNQVLVVGEDALCCALGLKLIGMAMPGWSSSGAPIDTKGITKLLPALPRYAEVAKHIRPVLCVADTDQRCPVQIRAAALPRHASPKLLFRLAVPEAESWVLGDRVAFSDFFQIPLQKVPPRPEDLPDAKAEVLRLARLSKVRRLREEVVSSVHPQRPGAGYNMHLCSLVNGPWSADRAQEVAPSLKRALERLRQLAAE